MIAFTMQLWTGYAQIKSKNRIISALTLFLSYTIYYSLYLQFSQMLLPISCPVRQPKAVRKQKLHGILIADV